MWHRFIAPAGLTRSHRGTRFIQLATRTVQFLRSTFRPAPAHYPSALRRLSSSELKDMGVPHELVSLALEQERGRAQTLTTHLPRR